LHTSKPSAAAQEGEAPTARGSVEPYTAIAKRGSKQLSLETPQNKAGTPVIWPRHGGGILSLS